MPALDPTQGQQLCLVIYNICCSSDALLLLSGTLKQERGKCLQRDKCMGRSFFLTAKAGEDLGTLEDPSLMLPFSIR